MRVEGAVGLVTGGASGLGEAVARMLVEGGGRVVVADLPGSRGDALAAELGPAARFAAADVTRPPEVEAAVEAAVAAFGRLDVTVGCAGIAPWHRVVASDGTLHPLDLFRRAVDVNLVGLFDVLRRSAGAMARNEPRADGERGLIVNVASIAGLDGPVGQAAYTASKGGVIALTLQAARDLARDGIRVLAIAPAVMDTPMLAEVGDAYRDRLVAANVLPKRLGRPDELAALVRTAMEVTLLNGEVLRLDGGARLPPR